MKKLFSIVTALAIFTACLFAFCSCYVQNHKQTVTFTLILGENNYTVTTGEPTLHKAIVEMVERKQIAVYEFSGTAFSPFVTKLDALEAASSGEFIALYHDIEDASLYMYDTNFSPVTKVVGQKTYFCSGVGVALLPTVDGATYYIFVDTFSGSF